MVNETRIYSSLQSIPYTAFANVTPNQNTVSLGVLTPGKYEIKAGGQMLADDDVGERAIVIGSTTILIWSNSVNLPDYQFKEITFEFNVQNTVAVNITRPGTLDAPPLSYQFAKAV